MLPQYMVFSVCVSKKCQKFMCPFVGLHCGCVPPLCVFFHWQTIFVGSLHAAYSALRHFYILKLNILFHLTWNQFTPCSWYFTVGSLNNCVDCGCNSNGYWYWLLMIFLIGHHLLIIILIILHPLILVIIQMDGCWLKKLSLFTIDCEQCNGH